jgi:uncharacterized membrane protein (UPF0127 family)
VDLYALHGGRRLAVATTWTERLVGLLPLRDLPADHGLLLPRCRSVHTFGMRFEVDLMWLGTAGDVVGLDAFVGPFRQRSCAAARGVIEVRGGTAPDWAATLTAQGCGRALAAILDSIDCSKLDRASGLTRIHLS